MSFRELIKPTKPKMKGFLFFLVGLFLLSVLFILTLFSYNSNPEIGYDVSEDGVKYDEEIENKFLFQRGIYVSVILKNQSIPDFRTGIKIEHSNLIAQFFSERSLEIVGGLDKGEFKISIATETGFSGFVDKEGFEQLKKTGEIEAIKLPPGKGSWIFPLINILYLRLYVWLIIGLISGAIILLFVKLNKERLLNRNGRVK